MCRSDQNVKQHQTIIIVIQFKFKTFNAQVLLASCVYFIWNGCIVLRKNNNKLACIVISQTNECGTIAQDHLCSCSEYRSFLRSYLVIWYSYYFMWQRFTSPLASAKKKRMEFVTSLSLKQCIMIKIDII